MPTVTQTIPNFYQGISQQPDEQKIPGQVRNAENVIPDIVDGLSKRPGLEFVKTLAGVPTDGTWFHYYRDEVEGSYVGKVSTSGTVSMWKCSDGSSVSVSVNDSAGTYLAHSAGSNDIQALTVKDTTFLLNRSVVTEMLDSPVSPSNVDNPVYVELKQVQPRRSYALNVYDNDVYTAEKSVTRVSLADTHFNVTCSGDDCIVQPDHVGSKIYELASGCFVRLTVTGQSYVGQTDVHDHTHTSYYMSYTARVDLLHGGTASSFNSSYTVSLEGRNHTINIDSTTTASYRVNVSQIRPVPVDLDDTKAVDSVSVLSSINDAVSTNVTSRIVGNGILFTRSTPFSITSFEPDLFNIVSDTVNDVSKLPTQCLNGFIVKVSNSSELEEDDYYLKFVGDNGKDGTGHWEECVKPGIKTTINPAKLPYSLVRNSNGTFTLGQYNWGIREVGDNITNEKPAFINQKINKAVFHQDRLCFLSSNKLILSQPDNPGNFWNKTALTFSGVDRIQLTASSISPNPLIDAIELNSGLILFSASSQYLFTTDDSILNPDTAKIYTLSTYNFNTSVSLVSLGTSLAFLDNAGKYTRFFEMLNVTREAQPEILEQSKSVQRLLPKNIDSITNSRENSIILTSVLGSNKVFGFKYFASAAKRLQGAWFVWTFAKNVDYQFIINDEYYVVSSEDELCKVQLMDTSDRLHISQDEDEFNVHLDYYQSIASSSLNYNSSTDVTTLSLPSDTPLNNGDTVSVIVTESNNNRGRYATGTVSSGAVSLNHDWSSDPVKVGKEYTMKVEFPTIYPTATKGQTVVADTRSSLILQRLKLNFGPVGKFNTTLSRVGKTDYIDIYEHSLADSYQASRAPYVDGSFRTIPVYERNTNVNVTLTSEHPSPANIESMSWEGEYNTRFYKRI
tara:strand:- start:755 stop:3460 length:2706 start_codon:yes stop_codon:yes gene_type:complete